MYIYPIIIIILCGVICGLILNISKRKKQVAQMNRVLEDIEAGNPDRRLVVQGNTEYTDIAFKINAIVSGYNEKIESLQQSEKTYKHLVTSLSHDVRTPLASLRGYLDAVAESVAQGEESEEFLDLARGKAIVLTRYIDTLFQWLKLESGEQIYTFEEKDLCELTRTIMAEWVPIMESSGFSYTIDICEEELPVHIDVNSYHRIVNNLLQNILTHSGGSKISVNVQSCDGNVIAEISDNGTGISEDNLPHIFEKLYKCDNARSAQGNGLGLAITRELVKANKGQIRAESSLGEGTAFIITVPRL